MSTPALRKYVQAHGGEVHDTRDGLGVSFPEQEPVEQAWGGSLEEQIEKAIARAAEFGTTFVRLWREKGDGWYAATSHEAHPNYSYVCQLDEHTGQPLRCECDAIVVCHHLGAVLQDWRERGGWQESDRITHDMWEETLNMVKAARAAERDEEAW